jgi:hypothetical protein
MGAVTIKMIIKTSMTSTKGVTLISLIPRWDPDELIPMVVV